MKFLSKCQQWGTCGYKTTFMHLQRDSNGNLHFNFQTKNGDSVMILRANPPTELHSISPAGADKNALDF